MTQMELEKRVIQSFLGYGDEVSARLLQQIERLKVIKRAFTGLGFYTESATQDNLKVDAVEKTYRGLSLERKAPEDTMHFILYIEKGGIHCLEADIFEGWGTRDLHRIDENSFYGGGSSDFFETKKS